MNKILLLICGLPASSKSFTAKQLAGEAYSQGRKIGLIDDLCIKPKRKWKTLESLLQNNIHDLIIISDPFLCDEHRRQALQMKIEEGFPNVFITYLFFENDPDQCLKNSELRPERRVSKIINKLSKNYYVPRGFTALPVWRDTIL